MVDVVDLYSICLFIQDHLDSDLSLMFLAKTAGLSRFRFHRVFKTWRGETLHDFVTRLRMERAAFELGYPLPRSGRRSVKSIAFASGYKSLSSFSHAFSSFARVSPRQFRYRMFEQRSVLPTRDRSTALIGRQRQYVAAAQIFHPLTVTVTDLPERRLAILESVVPGYKPLSPDLTRRAAVASGRAGPTSGRRAERQSNAQPDSQADALAESQPGFAFYGVAFLPELFARARRSHGLKTRGAPLTCIGIDEQLWRRLAVTIVEDADQRKRASLTLAAGRYAVIEGEASLARLYRVWRRGFDAWLAAVGECPRPERAFVRWTSMPPRSIHEVAHFSMHVPLEPLTGDGQLKKQMKHGSAKARA